MQKRLACRLLIATATVGLLFCAAPGAADQVFLRGSSEPLEGRVISESEGAIVFQTPTATLTISRDRIERIEEGVSLVFLEQEGDRARSAGELEDALANYRAALERDGSVTRIARKAAEVERQLQDREYGEFAPEIRAAREHQEAGRLSEAQAALFEVGPSVPEGHSARDAIRRMLGRNHFLLAQRYMDAIDYVSAERELERALEYDPANADVYFQLGELNALSSRGRADAIRNFLRGVELAGDSLSEDELVDMAYRLAELYRAGDEHANAVRFYRFVYDRKPVYRPGLQDTIVEELTALARLSVSEEDLDVAKLSYREALAVQPQNIALNAELAQLLLDTEEWEEAAAQYQRLLDLSPAYSNANFELAMAYRELNMLLDARRALEREVEVSPENYEALCLLGDFELLDSKLESAREYFERAYAARPTQARAQIALARIERQLENYPSAMRFVRRVLTEDETNLEARSEYANILRDQEEFDAADVQYTMVIDQLQAIEDPTEEQTRLLADALIAQGEVKLLTAGPATATRVFNRALEIDPDYAVAYMNIGNAYRRKYEGSKRLDDLFSAEEQMLKAREIEPENPQFALNLGRFYHTILASADEENSLQYFRRARQQYEEYKDLGGASVNLVDQWLAEIGNLPPAPEPEPEPESEPEPVEEQEAPEEASSEEEQPAEPEAEAVEPADGETDEDEVETAP